MTLPSDRCVSCQRERQEHEGLDHPFEEGVTQHEGHFTVTPELQAAALGCFATHLALRVPEDVLQESLSDLKEIDSRFHPIVQVYLEDAMKQIEMAAQILQQEGEVEVGPNDPVLPHPEDNEP